MEFSIIVPIYFYNNFVEEMVNSLNVQTYKNFEIVFVGNGFLENEFMDSKRNIESIFNNSPIKRKYIYTEIKGANNAREVGLKNALGDYVFFLDSDDQFVNPNVLFEINEILSKNNIDILSVNLQHGHFLNNELQLEKIVYSYLLPNEILTLTSNKNEILINYGTNICARFIKRNLLENVSFLELPYCQDWNVSSKLFYNAKTFYFHEKPCYVWVFRDNSISKKASMDFDKHIDSFKSIEDILAFYKCKNNKKEYDFFLNDRIIKFCFQYIGRSIYFDFNKDVKKCLKFIHDEVVFNKTFYLNKRIVMMYLMIRFKFLFKFYLKLTPELN